MSEGSNELVGLGLVRKIEKKYNALVDYFLNKGEEEEKDFIFLTRAPTDERPQNTARDREIDCLKFDCVLDPAKNYDMGFGNMPKAYLEEGKHGLIVIVVERKDLGRLFQRNKKGYYSPKEVLVQEAFYLR